MTPEEFKSWRKGMGYTQAEAAAALGIGMSSVRLYEHGKRHEDGRPVVIPRTLELACAALAAGIDRYEEGRAPNKAGAP